MVLILEATSWQTGDTGSTKTVLSITGGIVVYAPAASWFLIASTIKPPRVSQASMAAAVSCGVLLIWISSSPYGYP